ncbi:cell wall protein [Myxococcus sp. RHSTA-1-4]|uniref:cell wall protein n=1 Tax=Myxococcus sp. RHSTA-1-4 TaxID=2874601 RepID=UPI001CBCC7E4|nr:cell wall protein [Myxococcus sp. RHSTA-1-4]MBZ4418896.1 cell wall protein [Myxococcus sp. RHSTA-1-4]
MAEQVAPPAAAEPRPRACAVIGCRNPVRSLGYCAAHYQKRRLMVATGRLHRLWVEDAAPHSLPDVILSRKRRAEAEKAAPPADAPRTGASPRAWVRKKGRPETLPSSAEGAPPAPVPRRSPAMPRQAEGGGVTATLERWATEFRAGKRGG